MTDFNLWDVYDSIKNEFKEVNTDIKGLCICGSSDIAEIDSMNVCKNCNNIIDKNIDNSVEWRYYGSEDNRDAILQDVVCLLIIYYQNHLLVL